MDLLKGTKVRVARYQNGMFEVRSPNKDKYRTIRIHPRSDGGITMTIERTARARLLNGTADFELKRKPKTRNFKIGFDGDRFQMFGWEIIREGNRLVVNDGGDGYVEFQL